MRRGIGRRAHRYVPTGSANYWLSFSDLMSALVLIFVLILFYVMYQYFDMYEKSSRKIAQQEQDLAAQQEELDENRTILALRQEQLDESLSALAVREQELADSQSALADNQAALSLAQDELAKRAEELEESRAALADREETLSLTQTQLAVREGQLAFAQEELADREDRLAQAQLEIDEQRSSLSGAQQELARSRDENDRLARQLQAQQRQVDEQEKRLAEQKQQLEALVGVRYEIIRDLSGSLSEAGIACTVDSATGAITLEADVLYASNQSVLKAEGQSVIDRFLPVYLGVLLSDEYRDYVAEIIVEGHTDSRGSYLMNLKLSQARALSVVQYILGDGYGSITPEQKEKLRSIVTANGRSYSDPVLDGNGKEDQDASRRVVFKFRLTDEEMIRQLTLLLEGGGEEP